LLAGAGTSNPRFTGRQATAAYNAICGQNSSGVPVEGSGGSGTRDAHWSESLLGNEIMTGYVGPGRTMPISRITVGSLADIGYSVNLSAADAYNRPGSTSVMAAQVASTGITTSRATSRSSSSAIASALSSARDSVASSVTASIASATASTAHTMHSATGNSRRGLGASAVDAWFEVGT
jgi:hypothetical protein